MFIRETTNHGQKYLSLAQRIKTPEGKWRIKYLLSLGSLKSLKKSFKNPKAFFEDFLTVVKENLESNESSSSLEEAENNLIPLKEELSQISLSFIYVRWILNQLGIGEFLDSVQKNYDIGYSLKEIFYFLVEAQIIDPSSFLHSVENQDEYIPGTDIKLYDVYRALDIFAKYSEEIQKTVYSHLDFDPGKIKNMKYPLLVSTKEGDTSVLKNYFTSSLKIKVSNPE